MSHTCLAKQLQQGGPATLCNLQCVFDDMEEVVQETKAHLQKTISVEYHHTAMQHSYSEKNAVQSHIIDATRKWSKKSSYFVHDAAH